MRPTIGAPELVRKGKGGNSGGGPVAITAAATAEFDTLDATISCDVVKVRNGTFAPTTVSLPNTLALHGTPDKYAYAGPIGTIIQAVQDDDGTWTIVEVICTCTEEESPPPDPEPI